MTGGKVTSLGDIFYPLFLILLFLEGRETHPLVLLCLTSDIRDISPGFDSELKVKKQGSGFQPIKTIEQRCGWS